MCEIKLLCKHTVTWVRKYTTADNFPTTFLNISLLLQLCIISGHILSVQSLLLTVPSYNINSRLLFNIVAGLLCAQLYVECFCVI